MTIAKGVHSCVKWFNVRSAYGFISRKDTRHDIFVHKTAIIKNNLLKWQQSLNDGEEVEFDVVQGDKGLEAANVTGPDGKHMRGSKFVFDRMPYQAARRRRPPWHYWNYYGDGFDYAYGSPPPMRSNQTMGRRVHALQAQGRYLTSAMRTAIN